MGATFHRVITALDTEALDITVISVFRIVAYVLLVSPFPCQSLAVISLSIYLSSSLTTALFSLFLCLFPCPLSTLLLCLPFHEHGVVGKLSIGRARDTDWKGPIYVRRAIFFAAGEQRVFLLAG